MFAPPTCPASLLFSQCILDKDKVLKDLQAQWGIAALALSCGIIHLELAILDSVRQVEADPVAAGNALMTLKDTVNQRVAVPLAHALRLVGGYFNDLSREGRKLPKGSEINNLVNGWRAPLRPPLVSFRTMSPRLWRCPVRGAQTLSWHWPAVLPARPRGFPPLLLPLGDAAMSHSMSHWPFHGGRLLGSASRGHQFLFCGHGSTTTSSPECRNPPST